MTKFYTTFRDLDSIEQEYADFLRLLKYNFGAANIIESQRINDGFDALYATVQTCDVLIIFVGRHFAAMVDDTGTPLLMDTEDYLNVELRAALQSHGMLVISILTHQATLPGEDGLPIDLRDYRSMPVLRLKKRSDLEAIFSQFRVILSDHRQKLANLKKRPLDITRVAWFIFFIFIGLTIILLATSLRGPSIDLYTGLFS